MASWFQCLSQGSAALATTQCGETEVASILRCKNTIKQAPLHPILHFISSNIKLSIVLFHLDCYRESWTMGILIPSILYSSSLLSPSLMSLGLQQTPANVQIHNCYSIGVVNCYAVLKSRYTKMKSTVY